MSSTALKSRIAAIFNTRLNLVLVAQRADRIVEQLEQQPELLEKKWEPAPDPAPRHPEQIKPADPAQPGAGLVALAVELLGEHRRDDIWVEKHTLYALAEKFNDKALLGDKHGVLSSVSTYMGWIKRGRQVQRGAKGTKVSSHCLKLLAEIAEKRGCDTEAYEIRGVAAQYREFTVFHISQTQAKGTTTRRSRR